MTFLSKKVRTFWNVVLSWENYIKQTSRAIFLDTFSTIHLCFLLFFSSALFTGIPTTTHRVDHSETRRLSRSVSRTSSGTFNLVRYLGLLTLKKKCEQGFLFLKYFISVPLNIMELLISRQLTSKVHSKIQSVYTARKRMRKLKIVKVPLLCGEATPLPNRLLANIPSYLHLTVTKTKENPHFPIPQVGFNVRY